MRIGYALFVLLLPFSVLGGETGSWHWMELASSRLHLSQVDVDSSEYYGRYIDHGIDGDEGLARKASALVDVWIRPSGNEGHFQVVKSFNVESEK